MSDENAKNAKNAENGSRFKSNHDGHWSKKSTQQLILAEGWKKCLNQYAKKSNQMAHQIEIIKLRRDNYLLLGQFTVPNFQENYSKLPTLHKYSRCGMRAPNHLTREALVELKAADIVFGALNSAGPDRRWMEIMLGKPVVDLNQ